VGIAYCMGFPRFPVLPAIVIAFVRPSGPPCCDFFGKVLYLPWLDWPFPFPALKDGCSFCLGGFFGFVAVDPGCYYGYCVQKFKAQVNSASYDVPSHS
jgi:hypothetical protein